MSGERIPFPPVWWRGELFYEVKRVALEMAGKPDTPSYVARMLERLEDYEYLDGKQDHEGATYRSVAYAGRVHGLDAVQRQRWIETAEMLGLTQRHVGHIIARAEKPPKRQLRLVEGGSKTSEPRFEVGETVRHAQFGVGEVVEAGEGKVVVRFGAQERVFVPRLWDSVYLKREGC